MKSRLCDACGLLPGDWRRGDGALLCDGCVPDEATEDTFSEILRLAQSKLRGRKHK